jgi:hypothetical protein
MNISLNYYQFTISNASALDKTPGLLNKSFDLLDARYIVTNTLLLIVDFPNFMISKRLSKINK